MSTHPPEQIYSEEAANVGFVMALGIMSAVAIVLMVGIILAAFYIRISDGIEVGAATMLVLCVLSAIPPISLALRYINRKESRHTH